MSQSLEPGTLRLWHRHNEAKLTWNGVAGTSGDEKRKPASGLTEISFPVLTVTPVGGVTEVGGGEGYGVNERGSSGRDKKTVEGDEALELRPAAGLGFTAVTLNFRIPKNSRQAVVLEAYRGDALLETHILKAADMRGRSKSDPLPLSFEAPVDRLVFRADDDSHFGLLASSFSVAALAAPAPHVVSVTPAKDATATPAASVQLEFSTAMDRASVEAAFLLTTDAPPLADDASFINPPAFDALKLTSMCEGRWRVRNPNGAPVRFTWDVAGQGEKGAGVVPASADVFFYTSGGSQTARLFADGKQQQVKASNPSTCGSSVPVKGGFSWQDGKHMVFTPDRPLEEGVYFLQVSSAAKSAQGQRLEPFASSFTVARPAPLPEPWRQATLSGAGSASFNPDNERFTLSVSGARSEHFVFQEATADATLTARVNPLVTTDAQAKAGLMLRQANAPESPFAFLYLTLEGRVVFEYSGEQGNVQRVEGGERANEAVYLRLERKEEGVYAYESDDGMNWSLLTTVALSVSSPFHLGLATATPDTQVQAQFEQVEVRVQETPGEVQASFTATPTSGQVPLTVAFDASASVGENLTYQWDFGDGSTGTGQRISHIYEYATKYGYFVVLTVTDESGSSTASRLVHVQAPDAGSPPSVDRSDPLSVQQFAIWHTQRFTAEYGVSKLLEFVEPLEVGRIESVTPDRSWVIYRERKLRADGTPIGSNNFHLVNLDTGDSTPLGKPDGLLIDFPYLSNDASMVGFIGGDSDVYVMKLSDMQPHRLIDIEDGYLASGIRFRSNGSELGLISTYISDDHESPDIALVLRVSISSRDVSMQDAVVGRIEPEDLSEGFGGLRWEGDRLLWRFEEAEGGPGQLRSLGLLQAQQSGVLTLADRGFDFSLPYEANIALGVSRAYGVGSHTGVDYYALDFNLNNAPRKDSDEGIIISAVSNANRVIEASFNSTAENTQSSCDYNVHRSNRIVLEHVSDAGDLVFSRYVHLLYDSIPSNLRITNTDLDIAGGQAVGLLSTTGCSSGPHLHFRAFVQEGGGKISILPEPLDGYDNFQQTSDNPYISQNTLEDLQMASAFSLRQTQQDSTSVMSGEEAGYDDAADALGTPTLDHDIKDMLTINSEEDLEVKVNVNYPGSTLFSQSPAEVVLRFRDDNKPQSSPQEHKRSRFLPVEAEKLASAAQQVSGSSSLTFKLEHDKIKSLGSAVTDTPLDLWLERQVAGGSLSVWPDNYPVAKTNATDVFRNPVRVRVIDIAPSIGGLALDHDSDKDPALHTINQPSDCQVAVTVSGKGISKFSVTLPNGDVETEDNSASIDKRVITYTSEPMLLEDGDYAITVDVTMDDGSRNAGQVVTEKRKFKVEEGACAIRLEAGGTRIDDGTVPELGKVNANPQQCEGPTELSVDLKAYTAAGIIADTISLDSSKASSAANTSASVEASGMFGAGTHTVTAEATKGSSAVNVSGAFQIGELECHTDDSLPPVPGPGQAGGKYPPLKMTQYTPKVRPQPASYGGGWGCFGNCAWGGGGGWGGWAWGLGGFGLSQTPVAKTFGDPHITTADGVSYSTMKLGEFVYARSTLPGGVEVQARQTRLPNFADWASFNTGAAVGAGGHVFEVRLPESRKQGDSLILLIDGEVAELPPGRYTFDDAFVEIKAGNELVVYYAEPGIEPDVYNSTATRVRVGAMTENALVRPDPATDILSLEISISTPPVGRYRGLFGTPDGNADNEAALPDGRFPETWDGFIEGWRVTSKSESLFTYAPGEGPETYNLVQDAEMPAPEDLLGGDGGFIAQAEALLRDTCDADLAAVDPTFVRSVAIELAAGRPAQHMVNSGICLDEHVDGAGEPEVLLSGLRLEGRLSLADHPEIDVPGASVTVYSPTLGLALCETATFKGGRYACGGSFSTPRASNLELVYRITGRGAPIEHRTTVPTPAGGVWASQSKDFQISVERVLHLTGRVSYASGAPVANARLQVSGPAYLQAQADAFGFYDIYLPLPDGVTVGLLTLEATEEDSRGYAKRQENLILEARGVTELERDLQLEPDKQPEPDENANKRTLVFIGRVMNGYGNTSTGDVGAGGVPVTVSAPGYIEGDRCEAVTSSSGVYNGYFTCSAPLLSEEGFTATLTAHNFGGATTASITVTPDDLPAKGATTGKEVGDFTVRPTTLRVKGKVLVPGEVDAQVVIEARAENKLVATIAADTSLSGEYDTLLSLPNNAPRDLELSYKVTLKTPDGALNTTATKLVEKPGVVGVMEVEHDIAFATHRLVFVGKVVNTLEPSVGVAQAKVDLVRVDTGAPLCTTTSDADGFYTCPYEVLSPAPFPVRLQVSGRGTLSKDIQVDPSQANLSGVYPVVTHLPVAPATLLLTGEVLDSDALPVERAWVRVLASGASYDGYTDERGRYRIVAALPDAQTSGALSYTTEYASPMGRAETKGSQPFSVSRGQLEEVSADFRLAIAANIDYDRISISGRLSNLTAPFAAASEQIDLLIEGSGPTADFGTVCRTRTRERGYFDCGKLYGITVPRRGAIELSYTPLLNGKPLAAPVIERYTLTPSTTLVNELYPELSIDPAMIKLSGQVIDLANQPVPQATVVVKDPVERRTKTDAQGAYDLYLPLPTAETSGTLRYWIEQSGVSTELAEETYSLASSAYEERARGTSQLSFNLFGRTLRFTGAALPASAPDSRLSDTTLVVSSPTEGLLCEAPLDAAGTYACSTFVTTPEAVDLEYTLRGAWGSATYKGQVAGGLFGNERTTARNFEVPVTVLEFAGTVINDGGTLMSDAAVSVSGALNAKLTTDENGRFTTTAILPDTLPTAELDVTVSQNGLVQTEQFSLPLAAGTLNSSSKTLTFTQRSVTLTGQLVNAFAPSMTLPESDLTLHLAGAEVCRVATDAGSTFTCPPLVLDSDAALELGFTGTGAWGGDGGVSLVASNEIPEAGTSAPINLTLGVRPTTVHLSGVVVDDRNNGLAGATVRTSGAHNTVLTTAADGAYAVQFLVTDTGTLADLTVNVQYGTAGFFEQETLSLEVTENALTEVTHDVTFAKRALNLTGTLSNRHVPEMQLAEVDLEVWRGDTRVCATATRENGSYTCSDVVVETAPLELRVETPNLWGSSAQTHTVPAAALAPVGGRGGYTLELLADTTTFNVSGVVSNESGTFDGANVTISGDLSAELNTNADGNYNGVFVLPTPRASLNFIVEASDGRGMVSKAETVIPTPGQFNKVYLDLVLGQLEPGQKRWSRAGAAYALALAPNGDLYARVNEGVVALKPDGSKRWLYSQPRDADAHLAVAADGIIYTGDGSYGSDGLRALNSDGEELWRFNTGDGVHALALGHHGEVYVAGTQNFYALKSDGSVAWQVREAGISRLAVGANGTIYAGAYGLSAWSPDGNFIWSAWLGGDVTSLSLSEDAIYVGSDWYEPQLQAFTPDGSTLWRTSFDEPVETLALTDNSELLVGAGRLYALNAEGKELWTFAPAAPVTQLVVGDNANIYVAADKLYALVPGGDELWSFGDPDGTVRVDSLNLSDDGTLFIGADVLYAVNSSSSGLADSGWAREGGGASNAYGLPHTRRLLRFRGSVVNQYTGESAAHLYVSVEDENGRQICSTYTDENGIYLCWAEAAPSALFITYVLHLYSHEFEA